MKYFLTLIIYITSFLFVKGQFTEEAVAVKISVDSLRGVLIVPDAVVNFPLVIIVPGSGPTDRNGNSPMGVSANSYKLIATALAKQKIGSLLFDKRGIAASKSAMVTEDALRFDTYVDDLIVWIDKIRKDKRVKKIIVAGHSEGSLIGMLATQRTKTDGYISIAGASRSIDKIIMVQLASQPEQIRVQTDSIFTLLKQDKKPDTIPPYLMSLFRPGIQEYMKSWMKYNPCREIQKLTIPVLIIQGSTDVQVSEEEGKSLAACCPRAVFELIGGMNHVLKNSPMNRQENIATYSNPALPVNETLVKAIISFVTKINK
ncbi:MAG: alpha/beta fold hydrolase [Bacteroidota bacterium]